MIGRQSGAHPPIHPSIHPLAASFGCLLLALILLSSSGCAPPEGPLGAPALPSSTRYSCLNDLVRRRNAVVSQDELTGVFRARVGERRVAVAPGIGAAAVGARLVPLGDPVAVRHGRFYVPRWLAGEIDSYLTGRPEPREPITVVREPAVSRLVGKVCLDPGHGGKDPGAIGRTGLREKDVNLATAHLLAAELRARGLTVHLTRESDTFVDLEERPAIASRLGCDLFVSIHANAMKDLSYSGLEIFYWHGTASVATAEVRRQGVELAQAIKRACERAGFTVRSMRGADYKVLRHSRVPATLVEIGFLTNPAEERQLATTAYRQRVAKAIADGIAEYRAGAK